MAEHSDQNPRGIMRQGNDPLNPPSSRFYPSGIAGGPGEVYGGAASAGQADAAHAPFLLRAATDRAHAGVEAIAVTPREAVLLWGNAALELGQVRLIANTDTGTCAIRATGHSRALRGRQARAVAASVDARNFPDRTGWRHDLAGDFGKVTASRKHTATIRTRDVFWSDLLGRACVHGANRGTGGEKLALWLRHAGAAIGQQLAIFRRLTFGARAATHSSLVATAARTGATGAAAACATDARAAATGRIAGPRRIAATARPRAAAGATLAARRAARQRRAALPRLSPARSDPGSATGSAPRGTAAVTGMGPTGHSLAARATVAPLGLFDRRARAREADDRDDQRRDQSQCESRTGAPFRLSLCQARDFTVRPPRRRASTEKTNSVVRFGRRARRPSVPAKTRKNDAIRPGDAGTRARPTPRPDRARTGS
jgi:hypothetical protein